MSITQFGMEMTRLVAGPRCRHGDHDAFGISATNRLLLWSDCNLIEGQKAYRRCLVLGGIVGPFVGTVRAHSAGSSCARATGSLKGGAETARPRADRDQGLYAHVLLSDIRADQEAVKAAHTASTSPASPA